MGIPVYLSRHTPDLPEEYGALVNWSIGERIQFVPAAGGDPIRGVIGSCTLTHPEAPVIDGARGRGRWVREVFCEDTGETSAVSEARLKDIELD